MKTQERRLARELRRREGSSIKEIARRLGVSQSSVSIWVRDVELTPQQLETLRQRVSDGRRSGRAIVAARRRHERCEFQESGRSLARRAEPLHVAGCMLFWAEGSRSRNTVRFTNSDPQMVRLFVRFLQTYVEVRDEDLRVTCNLFADHLTRQQDIERFWLDTLGLPLSCLCRSTLNTYSKHSKKKRQNRLPYGTCRIAVSRTSVVQSLYGSIQEYAGFERPEWLD